MEAKEALILGRTSGRLSCDIGDYPGGIIIPVDKPYRWTSADVIRKIKYAAIKHFGKKNLKVGHAGTLDPLATGVLLVCIGNATKLAESLQAHDKEYVAGIAFGATTPSYDLEKEIDRTFPFSHISADSVREVLEGFIGEQDQVAPLFSAKSVDGVRAYELARKLYKEGQRDLDGDSPIRASRIVISSLELLDFREKANDGTLKKDFGSNEGDPASAGIAVSKASSRINVTDNSHLGLPEAVIRIKCSKGTYIRAFARDLGEALGSGAHLASLQRSRSGDFQIDDALTVDEVLNLLPGRISLP
ncbi:MAG: tRNA pseudouridine(55) synthase TruB [Candidatus Cryptobacteroides sp.]